MWIRSELKARAKDVLRTTYWKAFLVSIVLVLVGGTSGSSGNGSNGTAGRIIGERTGEELLNLLPVIFGVGFLVIVFFVALRVFVGYPLEVGGRRKILAHNQSHVLARLS